MKTRKILFLNILGLSALLTNAQNISSTAQLTSGGLEAGNSSTGGKNTFYGYRAGKNTTSAFNNVFIGNESGLNTVSGNNNFFGGDSAGIGNVSGSGNVFIGGQAGENSNGYSNVFIGSLSGANTSTGNENVYLGNSAGAEANPNSSRNVFIGYQAGFAEQGSNKLIIANYEDQQLIWGDFVQNQLKFNAKVGVGYGFGNYPTTAGNINISNYNLFVKGGILTEEVRVSLQSTWADYVFKKDYKLPTLQEVEKHIAQNGHLINVPSAEEVACNGIELGEMTKIQQEKIEELTLYIIEQNKINEKQAKEINELKVLVKQLIEKK